MLVLLVQTLRRQRISPPVMPGWSTTLEVCWNIQCESWNNNFQTHGCLSMLNQFVPLHCVGTARGLDCHHDDVSAARQSGVHLVNDVHYKRDGAGAGLGLVRVRPTAPRHAVNLAVRCSIVLAVPSSCRICSSRMAPKLFWHSFVLPWYL